MLVLDGDLKEKCGMNVLKGTKEWREDPPWATQIMEWICFTRKEASEISESQQWDAELQKMAKHSCTRKYNEHGRFI